MKDQRLDVLTVIPEKDCQDNDATQQSNHLSPNDVGGDNCSKHQIFLGGSCNPTTWRHTVAIPLLKNLNITYYNPQVDDWRPEMVQLESQAKLKAEILFFVIDKQTRSTVGMIESAFIAGSKRTLILVIYPFTVDTNSIITPSDSGSKLTKNTSLTTVSNTSTASIISSSSASSLSSMSIPTQSSSECTNYYHSGATSYLIGYSSSMKISGEYITPIEFAELRRARLILQNLVLNQNIPIFWDIKHALIHAVQCLRASITPQELTNSEEEEQVGKEGGPRIYRKYFNSSASIKGNNEKTTLEKNPLYENNDNIATTHQEYKDIYLCLTDGDHSWRESIALPWFDKNGISCNFVPKDTRTLLSKFDFDDNHETLSSEREDFSLIRQEIFAIEHSRILLFVITNKCRGLSIMLLAAHYMSLGREEVVLCIQYLEEPCVIEGETLSKTAIADYNRGRIYLCDHAKNSHVPVFNNLQEAIECCGKKCKNISRLDCT